MASQTPLPLVEHSLSCVIRGHHIYKSIWLPYTEERLSVEIEGGNTHDFYTVSMIRDDSIIGHVPSEMALLEPWRNY